VIIFEFELFDAHISILTLQSRENVVPLRGLAWPSRLTVVERGCQLRASRAE